MALVIEDGTMPEGANTFASVADTDAYFSLRGNGNWPAPIGLELEADANLAKKENALVRASDYLNTLSWLGFKKDWNWHMCWPRRDVAIAGSEDNVSIPDNVVPEQVKRACMELAALFYSGEDLFAPVERGGRIQSETVGPISTTYFDDAAQETFYPAVAGLIGDMLSSVPGADAVPRFTMHKIYQA